MRNLFSRIDLKDIFWREKLATWARYMYISKGQSDFVISRGFYFHETSHMQTFVKIKPSRKGGLASVPTHGFSLNLA